MKKCLLPLLWLSLLAVWNPSKVSASHIAAADLTYRCIDSATNTYIVRLVVYRDCAGSPLQLQQGVFVSSAACGISPQVDSLAFVGVQEVSAVCPAQLPLTTCADSNGIGLFLGVEEYIFEDTVTLSGNCADWTFSWAFCCRNPNVTNMDVTPTTNFYIESTLDNTTVGCNSSPVFSEKPVVYTCVNQPFSINLGGYDPDGDSLAYELITPQDYDFGTNTPFLIDYEMGFSATDPISTPPNGFAFDPLTGQIAFTPDQAQRALVAVLVKEYRDGVLIGTTIRDLTVTVQTCSNQTPILNPPINIVGGNLTNNTFSVCIGDTLSFDISGYDPDGGNIFVETNIGQAVPGATDSITYPSADSFLLSFEFPTSLTNVGTYYFNIRAYDDGCPFVGEASIGYLIQVNTGLQLPLLTIDGCPSSNAVVPINYPVLNTLGPYDSLVWFTDMAISDPTSFTTSYDPTLDTLGGYGEDYVLTLFPQGACPITAPIRIRPQDEIVTAADSFQICQGDSVQLNVQLLSGNTASISWTPSGGLALGNEQLPNPIAIPDTTTLYQVVFDAGGCSFTDSVLVEVINVPSLNPIGDQLLCLGDTTTISVSGTNLEGLTPQWFPISTLTSSDTFVTSAFPIDTTTYTVTVGNVCDTISESVDVLVVPPMSLNSNVEDVLCTGEANGEAQIIPIGGSQSGLSYTWSPNVSITAFAAGLDTGSYTIAVSDAAGCEDTITINVDEPTPVQLVVDSIKDVSCVGQGNGEISLSASGGTPGYTFSLDDINYFVTSTFTGLLPGSYTGYVQDVNGCVDTIQQILVQEPVAPLVLTQQSVINPNCNSNVGEINVLATGGTPGYTYTIDNSPPQASPSFTNLPPGNYLITVEDTNGCVDALNITISEIADPRVDIDTTINPLCFGDATGSAILSVSDGLSPYQVVFGTDTTTLLSPGQVPFNNLVSGIYNVITTDANGCIFTTSFEIVDPDSLFATVSVVDEPTCSYTSDGSAQIVGGGGTDPYLYSLDSNPPGPNNLFSGLLGDSTYTLTLVDGLGCEVQLPVSFEAPPALSMIPFTDTVTCPGGADGNITISTTGGNGDYDFSIDNEPFGNPTPFADDSVFINLLAGVYRVVVQDREGCVDSLDVTVVEPDPLSVSPIEITDVRCFGAATGNVALIGSGGTLPYEFALGTNPFSPISSIDSLRVGSYIIRMQDANGCLTDTMVQIDEPGPIGGSIISEPVTCAGDSNGFAAATVNGGVSPYQYSWSNGATGSQVFNLPPGNPSVLITDGNDCQFSMSTEILEPPAISIDSTNSTDASCYDLEDGSVLASASGGTGELSYAWSNGNTDTSQFVGAGVYDLEITDENGCTSDTSLEVNEPPAIIIEVLSISPSLCGAPIGEIIVEAMGGAGDFQYQWNTDPPQAGPTASGLPGGPDNIYTVLVEDADGCTNSLDTTVEEIGEPMADFDHSFAPLDTFLYPEEGVQFINRSQNGVEYLWEFGDGDISNDENPTHVYPGPGTYTISLVALDFGFACPDTTEQTIVLLPPGNIWVPNVFTPNNDDTNDNWSPIGLGIVQIETQIYSRWGLLIATLNSLDEKWDGRLEEGGHAPEGVYVYKVRAVLNDGRVFTDAGTVTLVR